MTRQTEGGQFLVSSTFRIAKARVAGSAEMIPVSEPLSGVQILAELNDGNGPFPHTDDFQVIGPTLFLMLGSLPRAYLLH